MYLLKFVNRVIFVKFSFKQSIFVSSWGILVSGAKITIIECTLKYYKQLYRYNCI